MENKCPFQIGDLVCKWNEKLAIGFVYEIEYNSYGEYTYYVKHLYKNFGCLDGYPWIMGNVYEKV